MLLFSFYHLCLSQFTYIFFYKPILFKLSTVEIFLKINKAESVDKLTVHKLIQLLKKLTFNYRLII